MKRLVALLMLGVVGLGTPAWAEPPGAAMTVGEWREFLARMENNYDARVARAVASFFAVGAASQLYLTSDCARSQTVGELSAWLRTAAPAELTLLEALEQNARERGCEPRGEELPAIEARLRDQTAADLAIPLRHRP